MISIMINKTEYKIRLILLLFRYSVTHLSQIGKTRQDQEEVQYIKFEVYCSSFKH